ncbi:MAG: hypothetical protein ASARMPREDX12_001944 [Alectoria sarmentosa]|nr:MAG: hypothetical protein ASARMPREDX12_001944 [Alectoria sarmentosa]
MSTKGGPVPLDLRNPSLCEPPPKASPVAPFLTFSVYLGISGLMIYYAIIFNRDQAKLTRRMTRATEMKALKARLERFHDKVDGGEVIGEEEMQEGKSMERLFRRWLRSLEDNAAADDDEDTSAAVKAE